MLFDQEQAEAIAAGRVTIVFRRWRRPQATAGHRYRTGLGLIYVDDVSSVAPTAIDEADARRAGYPSAAALLGDLRGDPDLPVTRVAFHALDEPDPRDVLASDDRLTDDDVAEIARRLDRMDVRRGEPWTRGLLRTIGSRPGTRAADLAAAGGRPLLDLKADVRRLKELGLTLSLPVGYRLSPRGIVFLERDPAARG
jgi:hypothetical protein